MSKKEYGWKEGAILDDHTKKKHDILKKYFHQYLIIRCKHPQREKFRIAIVDGFSGAGLYQCGSHGSPIIFIEVLANTANEINLERIHQGMKPIQIECLLIFNDINKDAIEILKQNITPYLIQAKENSKNLHIETHFFDNSFDQAYTEIKSRILMARCSNVFFNLDQCGYSHVTSAIIRDIVGSWKSAEVILTFVIGSMLSYLSSDENSKGVPLEPQMKERIYDLLKKSDEPLGKKQWLGEAEKIAFSYLKDCATYVSPFSINNPSGWRYWLMHFANSYRARQVYNDILHQDEACQAHFGRAGLKMLSYDPRDEGRLYLFDGNSREFAKQDLHEDVPRFIAESGDSLLVQDFYAAAYSETPAHSDDIHQIIIDNPDIEVITETGGTRRVPNTIQPTDMLKLKSQKSMIFMFPDDSQKK